MERMAWRGRIKPGCKAEPRGVAVTAKCSGGDGGFPLSGCPVHPSVFRPVVLSSAWVLSLLYKMGRGNPIKNPAMESIAGFFD